MAMGVIWTVMVAASLLCAVFTGNVDALGSAAFDGAEAAVRLCLSMGGIICLWSGVIEIMNRSGVSAALSGLLRPLLARLFPNSSKDREVMDALSANVSANLLGLGNAATPMGIKAATGMLRLSGGKVATDELCLLVVMNTASLQLLPTTVAAVRAAAGAGNAFDILPAVLITSLASVTAGIAGARLLAGLSRSR